MEKIKTAEELYKKLALIDTSRTYYKKHIIELINQFKEEQCRALCNYVQDKGYGSPEYWNIEALLKEFFESGYTCYQPKSNP